jgi:putative redox protein
MKRDVAKPKYPPPVAPPGTVVVAESGEGEFMQYLAAGGHVLYADEPVDAGGGNRGPGPYELLLMGLGACTSVTVRLYAARKGWPLERVLVRLSHARGHVHDSKEAEKGTSFLDRIACNIDLVGELLPEQRARLLEIAKQCPVHRTLSSRTLIETELAGHSSVEAQTNKSDAMLDESLEETFPASDPIAFTPKR